MKSRSVWGAILVGGFLWGPVRALDMTPEFIPLRGEPGRRIKAAVTLVNDSAETVNVRLSLQVAPVEGEKPWVTVSPQKFRLRPGKKRVARLKVKVPLGSGEREAQVWARVRGPLSTSEIRVIRKVHLVIEGTERYALSIESLRTVGHADRVSVTAGFLNEGNVTLRPALGADLGLVGGGRVTAYQEGNAVAVAPGNFGSGQVDVLLSQKGWDGTGTVTAYYRDSTGTIHQVEKMVGD
jgi:hypothetical protein